MYLLRLFLDLHVVTFHSRRLNVSTTLRTTLAMAFALFITHSVG
jgi:hypothetical protein